MELTQADAKSSRMGWITAIAFAAGPFLYLNIGGRGLFMYIAVLFVLALAINVVFNRGRLIYNVPAVFWPYMVMIIWQLIGFGWSTQTGSAYLFEFVKNTIFVILLCANVYSQKEKQMIHIVQAVLAVFLVVMMLLGDQSSKQGRYTFEMFGVVQDPNYMCLFLLMPFCWCLQMVMLPKKNAKLAVIICTIATIILATAVLATGSRSGLLGLLACAVVFLLTYRKMNAKYVLIIIVFSVCAVIVFSQILRFLPEEITQRFHLKDIVKSDGRIRIWEQYIRLIFDDALRALFGHGTFSCLRMTATHNYLLEIWYENGLVGLLLAVILYVKMFLYFKRTQSWISMATLAGALVMSMFLSTGSMLQYWLCIASTIVLSQNNKMPVTTTNETEG